MRRHGAHQVAQKSTRTTPFLTSSPKFASVNVLTFSDAMSPLYLYPLDAAATGTLRGVSEPSVPSVAGASVLSEPSVAAAFVLSVPSVAAALGPSAALRLDTF